MAELLPALSVIVIAPFGHQEVERTLRAWGHQSARKEVELVLVCVNRAALAAPDGWDAAFGFSQIVEAGELTSSAAMRTAGIRVARAPVVAFTEDHCFPAPGWAERLLARHAETEPAWTGVAPAIRNANPQTAVSWTNYLIEYGDWAPSGPGGPCRHLPGHNSSYKKAALLTFGDRLATALQSESNMQWELAQTSDHQFYLETEFAHKHLNYSLLSTSLGLRFACGRLFGGNRFPRGDAKRLLYALATPAIFIVRFRRLLAMMARTKDQKPPITVYPTVLALLLVDVLGEGVGYVLGPGSADAAVTESEFRRWRNQIPNERHQPVPLGGEEGANVLA